MSRQQRLAVKASKLIVELYKMGIEGLSIDVGLDNIKLEVYIRLVRSVTATSKKENKDE